VRFSQNRPALTLGLMRAVESRVRLHPVDHPHRETPPLQPAPARATLDRFNAPAEEKDMRTHALLVLFGVAACGGRTTADLADGGLGGHRDSAAVSEDAGSGSGNSSGRHTRSSAADSGMSQVDGKASDAVIKCTSPASGCTFCDNEWHCPHGGILQPCPPDITVGDSCSGDMICFVCPSSGSGVNYSCFGTWGPPSPSYGCSP
jgi:hypothetical protein